METTNQSALPAPSSLMPFDLWTWIGKTQAFGLIANRCSAAQAECLHRVRESRAYEALGLNWEQYCRQHAGISRPYADSLIQRLREFGPGYFELASVARISQESYRLLAPAITDKGIEIDGQVIAITPKNAPRIRQIIVALRADLRLAQESTPNPNVIQFQTRFDSWFDQLSRVRPSTLDAGDRAALQGLVTYCRNKLKSLADSNPFY